MDYKVSITKKDIIYSIIILVMIISLVGICIYAKKTKDNLTISEHNIVALTDSIKYHKSKNNELIAEKTALIGDINILKAAKPEVAKDVIENMGIKTPSSVVYIETVTENIIHDTIFKEVECDSTLDANFDFSDQYRVLKGGITCNDGLELRIDSDVVYSDYTLVMEDNKVYVKSNNPHILYNDICALDVPEYEPKWCFVIGPSVSIGWDPIRQFVPNQGFPIDFCIGVSGTFGFNVKGVGKRVKKH